MSAHGIKLGAIKGPVDINMVGIEGGETYLGYLGQEDVMCDVK